MNNNKEWRYYNHSLLPTCAPHETPNTSLLSNRDFWTAGWPSKPLFARWTSDFDCNQHTEWWYCVKDTPYEIDSLSSKKRYVITKARKFFNVKIINPVDYAEELASVQIAAFSAYPESYRPNVNYENLVSYFSQETNSIYFGAFFVDTNELCGYSVLTEHKNYVSFSVQKTKPNFEKYEVNAALVDCICLHYSPFLSKEFYIYDGERSIFHETSFQSYLEKYFGFRKVYCKLHLRYRPVVAAIIHVIYPFRKLFSNSNNSLLKKVNAVLKMETIRKSFL